MPRPRPSRRALIGAALALPALALPGGRAAAQAPVTIRVGYGTAGEEQLWLMQALPSAMPNLGRAYGLEMTMFRGTDTRFKAFESGQIDLATASAQSALLAAGQGVEFSIVASICREEPPGFVTTYMVPESSPLRTVADLRGKVIGINAVRSSIELWARAAVRQAGMNPDRDVRFAVVPFPSQGEALRAGRIDVGAFPQPFFAAEMARGGVRPIFTSKTGMPGNEELQVLVAQPRFMRERPEVLRAFLSDFVGATQMVLDRPREARQALLDGRMVAIPAEVFLGMHDYARARDARVDVPGLARLQDTMVDLGFMRNRVDVARLVNHSFLPAARS